MQLSLYNIWAYRRERIVARGPNNIWMGIPTNCYVSQATGKAVMGRGIAKQAVEKYPGIDVLLGALLQKHGPQIHMLYYGLFSIPVKDYWMSPASLDIIAESVTRLNTLASSWAHLEFLIPLLGCGNGLKDPLDVCPLLQPLPDNVTLCINEPYRWDIVQSLLSNSTVVAQQDPTLLHINS